MDRDTLAQLPHEIELWNASGKSYIWVKIPRISAGSEFDSIYMYYGDAAAPDDPSPDALWSEYELVYHFFETYTGSEVEDSTVNGNHGSFRRGGDASDQGTLITPTLPASIIGHGFLAESSNKDFVDAETQTDFAQWTVEVWAKGLNAPGNGAVNGPLMGFYQYDITWDHSSDLHRSAVQCRDTGTWRQAPLGPLQGNTWYYLVGVYDPAVPVMRAYKNGALNYSQTVINSALEPMPAVPPADPNRYNIHLGTSKSHQWVMDGYIDEVRISSQVRSAEWIRAQYLSMTDAFISFGEPEPVE